MQKSDRKPFIRILWIISFAILWIMFGFKLPKKEFKDKLNKIEESVVKENWNEAKKSMEELKEIYNKERLLIQSNNATEILLNFDFAFGQLDSSIQNEEDSALEYIGGLKSSLDYIMKAFPGP